MKLAVASQIPKSDFSIHENALIHLFKSHRASISNSHSTIEKREKTIFLPASLGIDIQKSVTSYKPSRSHHSSSLNCRVQQLQRKTEAMASKTATKDIITLRGSAAIVSEFFGYAANSILYNRGVYPEESFTKVKKYGLPMLLTQDDGVKSFISNLNSQLSEWLEAGKLQRIVLVIMSKATGEVLERWNFSIETDSEVVEKGVSREKSDKEIMREIQAIMRQIASSITYLPCFDEPCVFDVLAYTDKDCAVPFTWIESDPKLIANPQMVKLHSFDTKIHKVDTLVSYKNDEWDEP